MGKSTIPLVALSLVLGLAGNPALVQATDWTGTAGDGDWMNSANWSPILPVEGERVDIESTADLVWPVLRGGIVSCGQLRLAYDATTVGELTVTGGATLNIGGELRLGRKESSPLPTGSLYVSDADTRIIVSDLIECGRYGLGFIEMTGGTLRTESHLRLAFRDGSSGSVILHGGTLEMAADPGITMGDGADDLGSVSPSIELSGGMLVLSGNQTPMLEGFISDGTLIGYGGTRPVEIEYDALSDTTIATAKSPAKAASPHPEDQAVEVLRSTVLNWQAADGIPASSGHQLFLSMDMDDVLNAQGGIILDSDHYTPPQLLEYDTTYYWRVDEANEVGGWNPGDLWSFLTEPFARPIPGDTITVTADSNDTRQGPENTINESGLDADDIHSRDVADMWLSIESGPNQSWIQYAFDKAYKLDHVRVWNHNGQAESFVGFGIKESLFEYSTDGIEWLSLGSIELARATISPFSDVNLQGVVATAVRITAQSNWGGLFPQYGLSEVRFMALPMLARDPQPASGTTDVTPDATLIWRSGREVALHNVYLGTNPDALPLVDTVSINSLATAPLDLRLDETYYWRVDEVNDAEDPSTWTGDVWNFSVGSTIVIDDMESYSNEEDSRIFDTWVDGFEDPSQNGALVGANPALDDYSPEQTVVYSGDQSLPIHYDNTAGAALSEATRTFASAQDWTRSGVQGLVLYFNGDPTNDLGQLYVKINDTSVMYDGDAESLRRAPWQKWYIPLVAPLSPAGLSDVKSLSIGIEGSGAGVLFIDDILLTGDGRTVVAPTEPSSDNLVAHYAFDGDASDSTGAYPATLMGLSNFEAGRKGQAVSMAGLFGDYVEITGYKGILGSNAMTVTAWINTSATETGTIIGWGPATPDGGRFGFRVDDNRIRCEFAGGNVQGAATINDGGWHHAAVTVQADATVSYPEVTLWVDGQDDTLPTNDETLIDILAGLDARIGSRPSAEDRWFSGLIDELTLYDRVLSAEEIAGSAARIAPFDK